MKALITGGKGFVGQHLKELLEAEGQEVMTFDLVDGQDILSNELYTTLKKFMPDYVYHLAAMTSVPQSLEEPRECVTVNIEGSVALLEAIRDLELPCHVLLASSTEVYRPAIDDTPLSVSSAIQPRTPYGVSKLAMEQLASIYSAVYNIHVIITRTTNHTGPGQDGPFAVTSFAKQIVAIERGEQDELKHGDLTSFKSYLDVRDVVKAYRLAIDMQPYIYNIASDETYEMQTLLDRLVANAKVPVKTSKDTALIRPYAPDKTRYETSSKLKEAGWKPEFNIERTLHDVLDYWRTK
jgi:GDP-4-dehydro-6-deoxy-D-mannose reductase